MKLCSITIVLCFAGVALSNQNATIVCESGYWGEGCVNVCGSCSTENLPEGQPICDPVTGDCTGGCFGNYFGDLCEKAECTQNCGSGECIAPGVCGNCGDISKVGPNCEDIRLRGLLGSLISFIVIISAISFCGFGSVWYKRRKNTAVAL